MDVNNFSTESVRSDFSFTQCYPTTEDPDISSYGPCKYERHGALFLPVFYSLLFVVGVTGNGLVMWVILMSVNLLSIVDICLLNLAVADLLLLITLPFLAHYSRADWVFGSGMCKVVMGSYYIGFNSSIFFVVIMSIDRYLAVVHAVKSLRTMSRKYRVIMIVITWVIGLLASFPELTLIGVHPNHNRTLCQENTPLQVNKQEDRPPRASVGCGVFLLLDPLQCCIILSGIRSTRYLHSM
ncbi:C-C chemokine receptor type 1-like isoform X2 [Brienomyrus brachyistius]|uniref:C-C chemokine receptor type 1-like isoform X2 n=1 Tax=Brienomyrus brachyistius TaxID=42636 RepID=UPI0020B39E17|nr:C-C chemokine receptor type 1-like isoform X2 [Brienomyrus brachyistius]